MSEPFSFRLIKTDGAARRGEFVTAHGRIQTPIVGRVLPVTTIAVAKSDVTTAPTVTANAPASAPSAT